MRQIALADYLNRIGGLIEQQRLPEAAAHCHFILQQHPRHLETYRLFGRVLLEQQLYDDAIDIFKRVLSVDPEDLMAHAGLSVAHKEKLDLPQAIWHMERAFELRPYDRAVREELIQMYASRDGFTRQKLELTEPALARLYYRGALFELAASELRELINTFPERTDLMILLAKSLFWNGNRVESVRVCHELLSSLPYCLEANAILAHVLQNGGRPKQARPYLDRLHSLTLLTSTQVDESTIVGQTFAQSQDIELPESVLIEELDDAALVSQEVARQIDWSDSGATSLDEVPSWLDELSFEPPDDNIADEQQADIEDIHPTSGMMEIGLREIDENGQSENEDFPGFDQDQLERELFNAGDEDQIVDSGDQTGLDSDFSTSELGEWSWESSEATLDEGLVSDFEKSDEHDSSVAMSLESAVAESDEQNADDFSDELWADAMEELSKAVDDTPLEEIIDNVQSTEGSGAEDLSADGWFDEITGDRNVTDELPGWLQDSVESTQEIDVAPAQDLQEWMDELPDESTETRESTPNIPVQSTEALRSPSPILSADSSIMDDIENNVSSQDMEGGNLGDYLSDNLAESEDHLESSSDESTDDWFSRPPGDSAIWLDEIAAEEALDRNELNAEISTKGVGQQEQESTDQDDDNEEKSSDDS